MSARWAIVVMLGGLACSAQPSFPRDLGAGGGGAGSGDAGGAGTASSAGGAPIEVQCEPGTGPSEECRDWAKCDNCPKACMPCDTHCIEQCMRQLYIPDNALSILRTPNDRVRGCDPAFTQCFAEPLGGVQVGNCPLLVPCCAHFEGSDDKPFCEAVVADGEEAACLVLHYFYATRSACE